LKASLEHHKAHLAFVGQCRDHERLPGTCTTAGCPTGAKLRPRTSSERSPVSSAQ
jgi:hypothetical protein